MATLKQRLHRKNASGTYDVIYFETSADLITGVLPVANGGTGITTNPSMIVNLNDGVSARVFSEAPRPGVTGTLSIAHGGTGATSAANARTTLGITLNNLGAAAKSTQVSATLLASRWSSATPPTQTVAVSGLGASQNGQIGLNKTATQTQRKAAAEAMLGITAQTDGSLTIVADGAKPTVDIPILITLLG